MKYDPEPQGAGRELTLPPLIVLPKGTWFNPAIDLRDPEGGALLEEVLAMIAAIEDRNRRRRPLDEASHQTRVRKILANGFRCHHYRRPAWVAYSRRSDDYGNGPSWLNGKAMRRTVDLLTQIGLLHGSLGELGTSSTYALTRTLCAMGERAGITQYSLTARIPPECLVRLRGEQSRADVGFRDTADTRHWTRLLEAYNSFLSEQDIGSELSADEENQWVQHRNKEYREKKGHDCPPLLRPERIQTDLYRKFNNGSFDYGGRLYGGWWITVPKELRRKITINGQPTIELDYSGCAPRMLYHERRIDYRADPYRLEPIAALEQEQGLEPDHFREAIKVMMQAQINGNPDKHPELISLPDGLSFHPHFKRSEVQRMIEECHAPIADAFRTGAGLRLQKKDGDLCLSIITALKDQGIAALPIHDSFIAPAENEDQLMEAMNLLYFEQFSLFPLVK